MLKAQRPDPDVFTPALEALMTLDTHTVKKTSPENSVLRSNMNPAFVKHLTTWGAFLKSYDAAEDKADRTEEDKRETPFEGEIAIQIDQHLQALMAGGEFTFSTIQSVITNDKNKETFSAGMETPRKDLTPSGLHLLLEGLTGKKALDGTLKKIDDQDHALVEKLKKEASEDKTHFPKGVETTHHQRSAAALKTLVTQFDQKKPTGKSFVLFRALTEDPRYKRSYDLSTWDVFLKKYTENNVANQHVMSALRAVISDTREASVGVHHNAFPEALDTAICATTSEGFTLLKKTLEETLQHHKIPADDTLSSLSWELEQLAAAPAPVAAP